MRVLVCGSRTWTSGLRIALELDAIQCPPVTCVIHGGAAGADDLAREWAEASGVPCEEYPAEWEKHGRVAGPIRNQRMLDEGKPDLVLAFRMPGVSKGTDDMVRRARKAGVRTEVVKG